MKLIIKVVTDRYTDTNKWFEVGNLSEFNVSTKYNVLRLLMEKEEEKEYDEELEVPKWMRV